MAYLISKLQIIYLTHTEVPEDLEGHAVGAALATKVLVFAKASRMKLAALCPFLAGYLTRHPEKASGQLGPHRDVP